MEVDVIHSWRYCIHQTMSVHSRRGHLTKSNFIQVDGDNSLKRRHGWYHLPEEIELIQDCAARRSAHSPWVLGSHEGDAEAYAESYEKERPSNM